MHAQITANAAVLERSETFSGYTSVAVGHIHNSFSQLLITLLKMVVNFPNRIFLRPNRDGREIVSINKVEKS